MRAFFVKPPERMPAGDVALRRMRRGDADNFLATVNENLEHLRPWMPWAQEPHTHAGQADYLARVEAAWKLGTEYGYGIWSPDERELLGACGLHARIGPGALEIGYWIARRHTGRGYAKAAATALTRAALSLPGVNRIEIHCDEANVRSAAVPKALGFRLDRTVEDEIKAPGEVGRAMIWVYESPKVI